MLLSPERAFVFRITHADNVPWILRHGLYCRNADRNDPAFRSIGDPDLIEKRATRNVPIAPWGFLSDYVPFYFTPWSPMLLKIVTGHGVPRVLKEEIVILTSSIPRWSECGLRYVFTDRHAYLAAARYFSDPRDLDQIAWQLLRDRDFKRDADRPDKVERYQAEALAYRHVPVEALLGIACYNETVAQRLADMAGDDGASVRVSVKRDWYF